MTAHTRPAAWSVAIAAAAFVVAAVAATWAAGGGYPGWFSDSVDYLLIADFLGDTLAHGAKPGEMSDFFRGSRFPPVYPLTLALGGAGTANPSAAYVVTAITAVLAMAGALAWYWQAIEQRTAALLLGAATFVTVGLATLPLTPLSEPLFLLLLAIALWLAERGAARHWLALALLVGLLPLVRTAGVAIVAALVPFVLRERDLRASRKAAVVAIAVLPQLAWFVYRRTVGGIDYASYLSSERLESAFGGIAGLLFGQPVRIVQGFASILDPRGHAPALVAATALCALGAVGWWLRLRRNRLDAWALPAYVAIVWIWPFPEELGRLLVVCFPLLLVCAYEGALALQGERRQRALRASVAILLGITVAGAATAARVVANAGLPVDAELAPFKRRLSYLVEPDESRAREQLEMYAKVVGVAAAVPATVPPGQCIYAEIPAILWLHAPRHRVVLVPTALDPDRPMNAQLPDCDWFFVSGFGTVQHRVSGGALATAIGEFANPVLASFVGPETAQGRQLAAALLQRAP